jgi:hypothetical protein
MHRPDRPGEADPIVLPDDLGHRLAAEYGNAARAQQAIEWASGHAPSGRNSSREMM